MDLVATLVIVCFLAFSKLNNTDKVSIYEYDSVSSTSVEKEIPVSELKVGNNLFLKFERRAYFKILDELGL